LHFYDICGVLKEEEKINKWISLPMFASRLQVLFVHGSKRTLGRT